jgi:hypothetical protein
MMTHELATRASAARLVSLGRSRSVRHRLGPETRPPPWPCCVGRIPVPPGAVVSAEALSGVHDELPAAVERR